MNNMNGFERAISFFAPGFALKRYANRRTLEVVTAKTRAYDAASKNPRTDGWKSSNSSGRTEVGNALAILRNRSRELARNNTNAKVAIRRIVTNTIGTGIRPNPDGKKGEKSVLKEAWKDWAEKTECDFDEQLSFYGIQRLVHQTIVESGEALIIKKINSDKKATIPFQLQVLEGDFIDTNRTFEATKTGSIIYNGVQFDKNGRLEGYWLFDKHPGDQYFYNPTSSFFAKKNVIHIYFKERAGQHRGVPFGVSSFIRQRDLDIFEDAEMIKQQISACLAAFVTNADKDTFPGVGDERTGDKIEKLQPGTIHRLGYNETITFSDPPSKDGYGDYTKDQKRGIASAYGTTYEAMTGDLSQVNFSSGRMGWLEFHREIVDWQENMLIPMLCNKVWEWFIDGCLISGKINTRVDASWTSPRREMIDPVKETTGMSMMVRNGFMSAPEAIRTLGFEPDEVLKEIVEWKTKTDSAELQLDSDPRYDKTKVVAVSNNAPLAD